MGHLDVVVGRDVSIDAHHLSANFSGKGLLNISLSLISLPVLDRKDFKMFENVNVGMLPDVLNNCNIG